MKFMHIFNQVEIRFWQTVIAILGYRRLLRFTLLLLLPMLCLSMAFLTTAGMNALQQGTVSAVGEGLLANTAGGGVRVYEHAAYSVQRIFVVLADDLLRPLPGVRGIWMVVSSPTDFSIDLFPLFPQRAAPPVVVDFFPIASFRLAPDGKTRPDFWQALRASDDAENTYLLLDDRSFIYLADLANETSADGIQLDTQRLIVQMSQGEARPRQVHRAQALLLQILCSQRPQLDAKMRFAELRQPLSGHMEMGRNLAAFLEDWPERSNTDHSVCQFPTLGTILAGDIFSVP